MAKKPTDDNLIPAAVAYGFGWFLDPTKAPTQVAPGSTMGFRTVIERFTERGGFERDYSLQRTDWSRKNWLCRLRILFRFKN